MKAVACQTSLREVLRWARGTLLAVGVAMIAYCGLSWIDASSFQQRARDEMNYRLHAASTAPRGARLASSDAADAMAPGEVIGSIEIPRLGLLAAIAEGTDTTTLRRAVGHIRGTGLPGHPENVGLAGHRDTFFRPLKDVRQNDIITLTTLGGKFNYRVVSTRVVVPTETSVLDSGGTESLTLVTCHPFFYVGSAPDRFIVKAERID